MTSIPNLNETPQKKRKKDTNHDESEENAEIFPIMNLPVEIRGAIFNKLPQRAVPILRSVCKQWAAEVDELYEFSIALSDSPSKLSKIYNLRVRECTIWKFGSKLETPSLLKHAKYLKILKISGPTTAENLKMIISMADELEHLSITRRSNFPWILNKVDCPDLVNLKKLKSLRLNSDERIKIHGRRNSIQEKAPIERQMPMMDCYFPCLQEFQIYKRFLLCNSNIFVTHILNFVAKHFKTLKDIDLNLTPLSCYSYRGMIDNGSSDESEDEEIPGEASKSVSLSTKDIDMDSLCSLKLTKWNVITQGSPKDLTLWIKILENQQNLKVLYFHWISNKVTDLPDDDRLTGIPWNYIRGPILNCSSTLVTIEIINLSMCVRNTSNDDDTPEVRPFDLEIFRNCNQLKSLILRCPENHGVLGVGDQNQEDIPDNSEQILMINGHELPSSIESLEICHFPMISSDIEAIVQKCASLRRLFFKECGKSRNLGITATIVYHIAKLKQLKFLDIIGFNDSTLAKKRRLELLCLSIGIPYVEGDTWLEFNDGASSAYVSLKPIRTLTYLAVEDD